MRHRSSTLVFDQNSKTNVNSQLNNYLQLTRMDRPVGSLLLLWPTLAALWMAADGVPSFKLIVIFTLGTFLMRSAGCVINDYADRKVDGAVNRTQDRPLATGAISTQAALGLFVCLAATAGLLVLFLNTVTQLLAIGGLLVAALYPFMKRWTHLPQTVLGAAFSWGILMAWSAQDKGIHPDAILMFSGSLLWIVAYDTMYAMVDKADDLKVGVKSTAILFGDLDRAIIAFLQLSAWVVFALLGRKLGYQHAFFVGLAVCAGLFIRQQFMIRGREPQACMRAFVNNIYVGFALFAGTAIELGIREYGI